MVDKRFASRVFTRIKAHYGPQGTESTGFVLNLSAEGLFLSGIRLHPPSTCLVVRLLPSGAEPIELQGVVRWGLRVPPQLVTVMKPGMGLLLDAPPKAYLDLLTSLGARSAPRADPRVEAHLEVSFYHRDHFLKEYTENISRGGLYIVTDEPFQRGDEIKIRLSVPDLATAWPITGRVAYTLDEEQARDLDTRPGVGLQITAIDPGAKKAFVEYVQRIMRLYE